MTMDIGEVATLAHGYTMADIDECTRMAFSRFSRASSYLDRDDRWEAAWGAIVEHLYESDERPTRSDLIDIGVRGIDYAASEQRTLHGIRTEGGQGANTGKYWRGVSADPHDFTDRLTERMALPQILGELTDLEYEAIATLAVMRNTTAAANALRIDRSTLQLRLKHARAKAQALWMAPDTPRTFERTETHCRYGHSRAEFDRLTPQGRSYCLVCKRNRLRRSRARGVDVGSRKLVEESLAG